MFLLVRFFSEYDLLWFPLCFFFLFLIVRSRANRNKDLWIRKLYYRAFYFKVFCVICYTLVVEFYFKGGDTDLYYQATKDLRAAIADDPSYIWSIPFKEKIDFNEPLFNYFYFDNYSYDATYAYMRIPNNFVAPKLALIPSYLFGNSYLCINLFFGFFAFGGAIRLFKSFYHFYPSLKKPLALASLFLPGVAFWSSGLLKDPITFGAVGFILYGVVNIIFKKEKYISSIIWILVGGVFLFYIKIYILLVFLMSLMLWLFVELNSLIKDKALKKVFTFFCLISGAGIGVLVLNYVTSSEQGQQFQIDILLSNIDKQRQGYERIAQYQNIGSNFSIGTSNPVLLALGGIVATFFRPFLWEVSSPIVLLSALEAIAFLIFMLWFMFKRGVVKFFTIGLSDGKILMCFVFAFAFAVAVGSATANFGTLSRYKIPCMPFYMIFLILIYTKTNLPLPKWFNSIVNFAVPK